MLAEGFIDDANTTSRPQLSYLTDQMNELKAEGHALQPACIQDEQAPECTVDGKHVINLASNNYLGLTTHPKLVRRGHRGDKKYGVVRARYGTGQRDHVKSTWSWKKRLRGSRTLRPAWCFSPALRRTRGRFGDPGQKNDFINLRRAEPCQHFMVNGARLSRAKIKVFRHKDTAHAEGCLKNCRRAGAQS